MLTPLERTILLQIRRARMLIAGDRVAVAVSGGADSVSLLRLLMGLRSTLGITLLVAHYDHALRAAESDADAQFVASLAQEQSLEYICERGDVTALAEREHLNLEDAARRLRYAFFQRIIDDGRATRVAVGHTSDDQAETVLARLFRGTGPAGLAGIYPVRGAIVRPLLTIRREELRSCLRRLGQQWREDSSNFDTNRQRAKIRRQLLPTIEKEFSPRIVSHLSDLARLSGEEQHFWASLVEGRFRTLVRKDGDHLIIEISDLFSPLASLSPTFAISAQASDLALQSLTERLIRRLYKGVLGNCQDLGSKHVEQVIQMASEGVSGSRRELPRRVIVERNFDTLLFSRSVGRIHAASGAETDRNPRAYQYQVTLPTSGVTVVSVSELGSRFLFKLIDCCSGERETKLEGVLDLGLLGCTLTLRNWRFGDSYKPHGYRRMRKLKELFLARRIPLSQRSLWPVIASGGKIVWARGMPLACDFCAGKQTKTGLLIEESRL